MRLQSASVIDVHLEGLLKANNALNCFTQFFRAVSNTVKKRKICYIQVAFAVICLTPQNSTHIFFYFLARILRIVCCLSPIVQ